jgi:hypothetical protein
VHAGAGWAQRRAVPVTKLPGTSTSRNFGNSAVAARQPLAAAAEPVTRKRRVIVTGAAVLQAAAIAEFDAHADRVLKFAYRMSDDADANM